MTSRVVIFLGEFLNPLYLTGAKWAGGRVVAGDVENGAWDFRVVGDEIHAKDGGHIVNRWPYNVSYVVEVPSSIQGNYNEVIDWAKGQLK